VKQFPAILKNILKDIFGMLKEIKILEDKPVEMTKMEEKLLKKERENS
jgi:hypothetical protein